MPMAFCGCKIEAVPISDEQGGLSRLEVHWTRCGLHTAAPDLLALVKENRESLYACAQDVFGHPSHPVFIAAVEKCDAVIAKAEAL